MNNDRMRDLKDSDFIGTATGYLPPDVSDGATRETEVKKLYQQGRTPDFICSALSISPASVQEILQITPEGFFDFQRATFNWENSKPKAKCHARYL